MNKRILLMFALSIPAVIGLTGCSGGVGGDGSNTYSDTAGTPIVRSNAFNDQGWSLIAKGQYDSAISAFNKVLSDSPSEEEAAEANNGLGWAHANLKTLADGIEWFLKAAPLSNDAKVGLGAAYIQMGDKANIEKGVNIIYKQLGQENPHFKYTPYRQTGVTNAEVHALLAYGFAAIGRNDDAMDQMEYAKELNPNYENTTIDQLGKIVDFLLR